MDDNAYLKSRGWLNERPSDLYSWMHDEQGGPFTLEGAVKIQTRLDAARLDALTAENAGLQEQIRQAMTLLNPACSDETLDGAIRNLQQAYLTEKENAEQFEDGWLSIGKSVERAIDELLGFIESGRPSSYAPWRDCDKRQMVKLIVGAIGSGLPESGSVTRLRAQVEAMRRTLILTNTVIEDMRNENRLHGHITDAASYYLHRVKPQVEAALTAQPVAQADDPLTALWSRVRAFVDDDEERFIHLADLERLITEARRGAYLDDGGMAALLSCPSCGERMRELKSRLDAVKEKVKK